MKRTRSGTGKENQASSSSGIPPEAAQSTSTKLINDQTSFPALNEQRAMSDQSLASQSRPDIYLRHQQINNFRLYSSDAAGGFPYLRSDYTTSAPGLTPYQQFQQVNNYWMPSQSMADLATNTQAYTDPARAGIGAEYLTSGEHGGGRLRDLSLHASDIQPWSLQNASQLVPPHFWQNSPIAQYIGVRPYQAPPSAPSGGSGAGQTIPSGPTSTPDVQAGYADTSRLSPVPGSQGQGGMLREGGGPSEASTSATRPKVALTPQLYHCPAPDGSSKLPPKRTGAEWMRESPAEEVDETEGAGLPPNVQSGPTTPPPPGTCWPLRVRIIPQTKDSMYRCQACGWEDRLKSTSKPFKGYACELDCAETMRRILHLSKEEIKRPCDECLIPILSKRWASASKWRSCHNVKRHELSDEERATRLVLSQRKADWKTQLARLSLGPYAAQLTRPDTSTQVSTPIPRGQHGQNSSSFALPRWTFVDSRPLAEDQPDTRSEHDAARDVSAEQ